MTREVVSVATLDDVLARDAMSTPVVTIPESGTIFDAWTVMVTCHVRHTVVARADRCLGVINDRDLIAAWGEGPGALRATPVRNLLRDRTCCVLPDAALQEVAAIMNQSPVDAVPVVEPDGKLIGLITASDLVRAVSRHGLHAVHPADDAADR